MKCAAAELGYPLVLKEFYGSLGEQVYLARDEAEAVKIVREIGSKGFLMQEFVKTSRGTDLRFGIVGGKIVYCVRRFSCNGDFRSNIGFGGRMEPFSPDAAQKEAALAAFRATGADFAGVDVLFGADGAPLVCEVNSNLHFKAAENCTGVDMGVTVLSYIAAKILASGH